MLLRDFANAVPFALIVGNLETITITEITENDNTLIVCFNKPDDPDGVSRFIGLDPDAEVFMDGATSLN
jgi:hypothetical protein